jgi:hypothetical protein
LLCLFFSKKYGKISFVSSARFVVRFALTLHSRTNTTGRAPHSRVLSNFPLSLRSRAASLFFAAGDDCVSEAVLRVCAQLHATFIWSTVLLSFSLLLSAYVLSSVGPEQRARDWDALSAVCVCVCERLALASTFRLFDSFSPFPTGRAPIIEYVGGQWAGVENFNGPIDHETRPRDSHTDSLWPTHMKLINKTRVFHI